MTFLIMAFFLLAGSRSGSTGEGAELKPDVGVETRAGEEGASQEFSAASDCPGQCGLDADGNCYGTVSKHYNQLWTKRLKTHFEK